MGKEAELVDGLVKPHVEGEDKGGEFARGRTGRSAKEQVQILAAFFDEGGGLIEELRVVRVLNRIKDGFGIGLARRIQRAG